MIELFKKNKKEENNNDKYELTKSVKLVDVKGYLQNEYDRASKREEEISTLEEKIEELTQIQIKYDAMLVIQAETQKRIEKQDNRIFDLKKKIAEMTDKLKLANSKSIDIKVNSENKLKQKDEEIKQLKKEIKQLTKKVNDSQDNQKKTKRGNKR